MLLFRYILKAHFFPFLFGVFVLISVFLLQFLMKFADRLIGKGLDSWIIIKLISYNLAWMVVLVVPMAVLVSTLMAFGSMAQNNEVAVMKASGISLYKMMVPPFLASIVVALLLIHFNNTVYPNANHAARLLGQDISRKKPTLSLVPGVFSQDVSNYSILVRDINQSTNDLLKLTIYDSSDPQILNIITAQKGRLYFAKNRDKLIMDLWNGEIHTNDLTSNVNYRKIQFEKHKIVMNADQFSFRESQPGSSQRGDRELSAQDMLVIIDSLKNLRSAYKEELDLKIASHVQLEKETASFLSESGFFNERLVLRRVEERLRTSNNTIKSSLRRLEFNSKTSNKFWVEIHKKYSLPVACIIFILIGAPLGTMTRKGGFGVAAGISLIFFLIYWAFLIGGEKLADRGMLSPFWGMWNANVFLGLLGIILTIKSAKERVTINFDLLKKIIPKTWRAPVQDDQNY